MLVILFLKHFSDTKMLQVSFENYPPMTASLVFSSLWRDDGLVQVCSGLSGTSRAEPACTQPCWPVTLDRPRQLHSSPLTQTLFYQTLKMHVSFCGWRLRCGCTAQPHRASGTLKTSVRKHGRGRETLSKITKSCKKLVQKLKWFKPPGFQSDKNNRWLSRGEEHKDTAKLSKSK